MSSLKAFLADRTFTHTEAAWGESFTMPDLVAIVLRHLKRVNDRRLGVDVRNVVLGHPVLFAGAEGPDYEELQELALDRLDKAAHLAGFDEVAFLDEPTAALMGEDLDDGLVISVDFGGGTFDVSIIELTPEAGDVLAIHGAAIGGELFDSLLFDAKMAPALGLGSQYIVNGKSMPVPGLLRRMRTLSEILTMASDQRTYQALEWVRHVDGPIRMVEEIVLGGHAYNFFRTIEATKIRLSAADSSAITFRRPGIAIDAPVTRAEFEALIERNLDRVDDQISKALADSGLSDTDVDLVVRTGGSSRIPAFVDRLARRFGESKLAERDAFSTVALGLGIRAHELWG
jgi:hypothetical chaperone protein